VTSANEIIWPGVIAWSCEISVVRTALLLSRLLSRFHLIAIVRASSRHRRMPRQSNDARIETSLGDSPDGGTYSGSLATYFLRTIRQFQRRLQEQSVEGGVHPAPGQITRRSE
jgi:hypothetical protein